MGSEHRFVSVALKATAGEKDPKNLQAYFGVYWFLLTGLTEGVLEGYREEVFDNLQCYYPITFEILEEEKGSGVIKTQLTQTLDRCLTESPLLLEDTI